MVLSPTIQPIIEMIEADRDRLVDSLTAQIIETLPRYNELMPGVLRESVNGLIDAVMVALDTHDSAKLSKLLIRLSRERIRQGFALSDYLRAIFMVLPAIREFVRHTGPQDDETFARGIAELEGAMLEYAALAANLYSDALARTLEKKNLELNRLNQALSVREKALSTEATETGRALGRANQFNQRVIESLSSGVMAVDSRTLRITLWSSRLETITGLRAEDVLGETMGEALADLGLPIEELHASVRATGRVPLTKMSIHAGGRERTVLIRAQRMFDEDGEPEGTVVVIDDISERELLIDSFARYVSRDLVDRLLARAEAFGLEGELKTVTLLFADIRSFTTLSEKSPPAELHELLNAYFRAMIGGIVDHHGFIDKFVGDNVMAIFNEGTPEVAAASALRAAADIQARIAAVSAERVEAGLPPVEVGIGINSGEVILGNIGSEERMDFTAIGDPVNVADRLQSIAKGGEILVAESTRKLAGGAFELEDRGPQQLKGRGAPVQAYLLVGTGE